MPMEPGDEMSRDTGVPQGIDREVDELKRRVGEQLDGEAVEEALGFVESLNRYSAAFDQLCVERHAEGQEEYGQFTFLENDVTRMMIEELADTANYCKYQAIKLMLLQEALERQVMGSGLVSEGQQEITLGVQAFRGTKDTGWGGAKS